MQHIILHLNTKIYTKKLFFVQSGKWDLDFRINGLNAYLFELTIFASAIFFYSSLSDKVYPDNELGRTDKPSLIPPWPPTIMVTYSTDWTSFFSISVCPSNLTKNWKGARKNLSSVFIINSFSFDKPFLIKLLQAGRQIHEMQFFKPLYLNIFV